MNLTKFSSISRFVDRNPQMVPMHLKLHYRVDPLLEFDSLKNIVDSSSRNVDFPNHKSGKTMNVICGVLDNEFFKKGPR
jgi:hypothetical protein